MPNSEYAHYIGYHNHGPVTNPGVMALNTSLQYRLLKKGGPEPAKAQGRAFRFCAPRGHHPWHQVQKFVN